MTAPQSTSQPFRSQTRSKSPPPPPEMQGVSLHSSSTTPTPLLPTSLANITTSRVSRSRSRSLSPAQSPLQSPIALDSCSDVLQPHLRSPSRSLPADTSEMSPTTTPSLQSSHSSSPRSKKDQLESLTPLLTTQTSTTPVTSTLSSTPAAAELLAISATPHKSSQMSSYRNSPSTSCIACKPLIDAVKHHFETVRTKPSDQLCKRTIYTWFQSKFVVDLTKKAEMKRTQLLKFHLNPFLASIGLPTWTSNTRMYTDWFLPEIAQCKQEEIRKGRPLHITAKESMVNYIQLLEALLQQAKEDATVHQLDASSTPKHVHQTLANESEILSSITQQSSKKRPRSLPAIDYSTALPSQGQTPTEITFERFGHDPLVFVNAADITIGRFAQADVPLVDQKKMSKRHASVRWDVREQAFVLHHFGRNSTRVDDASLSFKGNTRRRPLCDFGYKH